MVLSDPVDFDLCTILITYEFWSTIAHVWVIFIAIAVLCYIMFSQSYLYWVSTPAKVVKKAMGSREDVSTVDQTPSTVVLDLFTPMKWILV